MTNEEASILRATTASICDILDAAANVTMRHAESRAGTEAFVHMHALYRAIKDVADSVEMRRLKNLGLQCPMFEGDVS